MLSGEARPRPVSFNAAPATSLVMRGLSERDSAAAGVQATLHLSSAAAVYLAWDGRFADGYDAHAAMAGLSMAW